MIERHAEGTYQLDEQRARRAIVVKTHDRQVKETRTVTADKPVPRMKDGEPVFDDAGDQIFDVVPVTEEVTETKLRRFLDLVVFPEPADLKRGVSGNELARGFLHLTGVQAGEGAHRFTPKG